MLDSFFGRPACAQTDACHGRSGHMVETRRRSALPAGVGQSMSDGHQQQRRRRQQQQHRIDEGS